MEHASPPEMMTGSCASGKRLWAAGAHLAKKDLETKSSIAVADDLDPLVGRLEIGKGGLYFGPILKSVALIGRGMDGKASASDHIHSAIRRGKINQGGHDVVELRVQEVRDVAIDVVCEFRF